MYYIIVMLIVVPKNNTQMTFAKVFSIDSIINDAGGDSGPIMHIYEVIAMITNFVIILSICVFWVKQARYQRDLDIESKTDADYAVMIRNLPIDIKYSQLRAGLLKAGIKDSDIIYTNK
jgi:hypothetical protein